jgi:hypothetical protein
MHRIVLLSTLLVSTTALANPLPPDLPQPQSGLWEMKTSIAEMGGMTMTFESCVDGTIEEMMQHPEIDEADCQDMHVEYKGNRIIARATCTVEGSRAEIVSDMTGDFKRAYSGEIRSTYTPPLHGMQKTTAKIDGRWIAPQCLPGQQPGDTRMKGGVNIPGMGNIDLDSLMKNMPGMNR